MSLDTKLAANPKTKVDCKGKSGLYVAMKMCASTCMVRSKLAFSSASCLPV